jgi:hypothetical protein
MAPGNSVISDKLQMNMFDMEIVVTQMKNNILPGYDEPFGTHWLHWVLWKIWLENRIPEDLI